MSFPHGRFLRHRWAQAGLIVGCIVGAACVVDAGLGVASGKPAGSSCSASIDCEDGSSATCSITCPAGSNAVCTSWDNGPGECGVWCRCEGLEDIDPTEVEPLEP